MVPTDRLEATLRLSRTEAAVASSVSPPLDRLLLAPHDMHRLGVRAGDWVAVVAAASSSSSASDPAGTSDSGALVSTPSQHKRCSTRSEVAVMRAWPATGMALPAGTVRRKRCICQCVWNEIKVIHHLTNREELYSHSFPKSDPSRSWAPTPYSLASSRALVLSSSDPSFPASPPPPMCGLPPLRRRGVDTRSNSSGQQG